MEPISPLFVAAVCLIAAGLSPAQQQTTTAAPPAGKSAAAPAPALTKADLEEMLAPIALYPDTLLANTLAACVYENDLKAAAKFVAAGGKVDENAGRDWDPSVKAIAAFPEVIKLLGDNLPWAVALGQAYLTQSADVMAAIQSLRARAWANGALKSTPQQTVVTEGKVIVIEPANPQIIYVPTYNPTVVYVEKKSSNDVVAAGVIGFGLGIAAGLIIANNVDCNWYGGCIGWGYRGGYHGGYYKGGNTNININGDVNIGSGNNNNIGNGNGNGNGNNIGNGSRDKVNNRIGNDGTKWSPNQSKLSPGATSGSALGNYKGVGTTGGAGAAKVPGMSGSRQPIASGGQPAAPTPRPGATQRPSAPNTMPAGSANRPSTPAANPSTPAARPTTPTTKPATPAARPSTPAPAQRPATPAARPTTPTARPSTSPAPRPSSFNPSGGGGSRASGGASRGGGGRR